MTGNELLIWDYCRPWTKLREKENGELTEVEKWWWEEFGFVEGNWGGSVEQWDLVRGTLH